MVGTGLGTGVRVGTGRGVGARVGAGAGRVGGSTSVGVKVTVGGTGVKVGRGGVRVIVRVAVGCARAITFAVRHPSRTNQMIPRAASQRARDRCTGASE